MDLIKVFEELAQTAHFDPKLIITLNKLPNDLLSYHTESSLDKMRTTIGNTTVFSDAVSVIK